MRIVVSLLALVACGTSPATGGDAGDAACTPPTSGPFVVASDSHFPSAIAFDGQSVFWTDQTAIMTASLCGGATVVASETGTAIAIDSANVYWTTASGVRMAPRAGGPAVTVTSTPAPDLSNIALDETYVYYGSPQGVVRVLKTGEAAGTLLETTYNVQSALAVDETSVYFGAGPVAGLMVVPKSGGTPTTLAAPAGPTIGAIAVDGANVYWATTSPQVPVVADDWVVFQIAKSGGSTITLASNEAPVSGSGAFVVDSKFVYWSNDDKQLRDVPISGGSVSTLRPSGLGAGLALSGKTLVWAGAYDSNIAGLVLP